MSAALLVRTSNLAHEECYFTIFCLLIKEQDSGLVMRGAIYVSWPG